MFPITKLLWKNCFLTQSFTEIRQSPVELWPKTISLHGGRAAISNLKKEVSADDTSALFLAMTHEDTLLLPAGQKLSTSASEISDNAALCSRTVPSVNRQ